MIIVRGATCLPLPAVATGAQSLGEFGSTCHLIRQIIGRGGSPAQNVMLRRDANPGDGICSSAWREEPACDCDIAIPRQRPLTASE
jgi:hypothetical protein